MAKPDPIQDYPDPPPPPTQTAMALTASSLTLTGAGVVMLLLWQLADCLNRLHLLLGLIELAVGGVVLWWTLSSYWPNYCRNMREYRAAVIKEREAMMEERRRLAEETEKLAALQQRGPTGT